MIRSGKLFCALALLFPALCFASYDEAMGKRHLLIAYALFWALSFAAIFYFGLKGRQIKNELSKLNERLQALEQKDRAEEETKAQESRSPDVKA